MQLPSSRGRSHSFMALDSLGQGDGEGHTSGMHLHSAIGAQGTPLGWARLHIPRPTLRLVADARIDKDAKRGERGRAIGEMAQCRVGTPNPCVEGACGVPHDAGDTDPVSSRMSTRGREGRCRGLSCLDDRPASARAGRRPCQCGKRRQAHLASSARRGQTNGFG